MMQCMGGALSHAKSLFLATKNEFSIVPIPLFADRDIISVRGR